jgi:hypothetical protein
MFGTWRPRCAGWPCSVSIPWTKNPRSSSISSFWLIPRWYRLTFGAGIFEFYTGMVPVVFFGSVICPKLTALRCRVILSGVLSNLWTRLTKDCRCSNAIHYPIPKHGLRPISQQQMVTAGTLSPSANYFIFPAALACKCARRVLPHRVVRSSFAT